MAEFALGLTKTAVEGTLSLVKSAVEEEKKLREAVQDDLVFITGEFEVMQSFLQAANREHAANDKVALTLVRQLRTLAFDVEDCVEFVVHLDLDRSSILGGLRRLWQAVNCRAPPLPLDVAVAEIKKLKARVEHVSQRNTRYNHILHGSDDDDNKQQQPVTTVTVTPLRAGDATTTIFELDPSSAAFHALRDAWKDTGKLSNSICKCNLQKELLIAAREGDHDLRVISVWGSSRTGGGGGGAGAGAGPGTTTSILTKAYCDPEICENFKIRVWVKLTHPFNHDEFVKSFLAQFYASSSHQANVEFTQGNLVRAKKTMMQQITRQRYLVVMEDVLTVAEWDVIRMYLPDNKNGSRILLSTPQLAIALLCTGEPYQVSELRNFSGDNQFLCAFSRKEKISSDIGEFYRQLLRGHGVISVWGDDDDEKTKLVDILYRGIINGWLEEIGGFADKSDHVDMLYEGIRARRKKFECWHSSWVDVPDPFDLKVFAQRLFLNFYSDDIRAMEITKVGKMGEGGLIQWCRKFLSEGLVQRRYNENKNEIEEIEGHVIVKEEMIYPYVVVINGLRSKDDWDLIQRTFLSSSSSKATTDKGCILVITEEETVATHCVNKGQTHLAFNAKDLKADPSVSALIEKGCWQYAIRGKKGRLFYDRRKDAQEWTDKFKEVGGNILDLDELKDEEEGFRVFRAERVKKNFFILKSPVDEKSTTGTYEGCNSEKGVLRHAYYGALFQQQQIERRCSWVDSPYDVYGHEFVPLNLMDFLWRLLLDFYSDDPQAKEKIAVGLMEEAIIDPIEKCREFLHNKKCLVVISSRLLSKKYWDYFISTLFSEQQTQGIIIIRPCVQRYYDRAKVLPLGLGTQEQAHIDMEYRRIFSTQKKYQEAIQWFETRQFVTRGHGEGNGGVEDDIRGNVLTENLVSVWGISGVGKSTLVKMVYYKEILYSSGVESSYGLGPNEAFAWVDVPSPFDLTDFAWCLLLNFYSDDPHAKESAAVSMVEEGRQVAILECRKILRTGKCLVVMDGLRSKQNWDMIKATFLGKDVDATIVVVTNEEEVAMHCVQNDKARAINITRLNADAALSLFEKIASKNKPLTCQEKELSKSTVNKCGGLPKVIADIGEVFVSMRRRWWGDPSCWLESLRDNFMCMLETDPELRGLRPLLSWMQSYFDACPDSIKPCIFYLSIFSAEKNIRLRRLLWRWIAEGYCRDTSNDTTYEENGEKFVSELVKLSIIQKSASNEVFCQINGFFHEYIISQPMEDNLVFALEGRCSLNSQRAGQHLTIRRSWDRNKIVYESIDFSRLRSLTVFGEWESFFICSEKVNMRLLRVLDLEDATYVENEDLDKIAKLLTRLKFLSLRGHTKINCLPISMGGLRQLQTLDIRGTSIVMLPLFITKLQKLRYIRAGTTEVCDWEGDIVAADGEEDRASASAAAAAAEGDVSSADGEVDRTSSSAQAAAKTPTEGPVLPAEPGSSVSCNNRARTLVSSLLSKFRHGGGGLDNNGHAAAGVTVPADIGNLTVLHTLGVVKVSALCGKAIFQELKKLTQLRKLGMSGINKENIKEFCEAISHHAHLKSLSVELDKDDDLGDNIPEPPKSIQSLKLYGRVNKLLVWMKHLDNLEKLHLTIEKPEELGDPPELRVNSRGHLRIRPIQDGKLHISPLWRRFTEIVEIQCSSRLDIKFGDMDGAWWWGIDLLKVHFSGGSRSSLQISGLTNVSILREVWLKGYTEEHKQYMQQQINLFELDNQKIPVLKLVQPCVSNSTSEPEAQADAPEAHTCVDAHCMSRLAGVMTCCAPVLGEAVSLLNQSSP